MPLTLRLPFAMADRHVRLEQVLAADQSRSWAQSYPLLACFALSGPERRFVKRLLERKRNIWLFRCNQRRFCGDFIAVDMSANHPERRLVAVVELKAGGKLVLGGGGASNQLLNSRQAVDDLATTEGVIGKGTRFVPVCGDTDLVLKWIERGFVGIR